MDATVTTVRQVKKQHNVIQASGWPAGRPGRGAVLCVCRWIDTGGGDSSGVRGAPLNVANRLHGQPTGAFSWRPVLRPFQEDQPYSEQRTWTAVSSVSIPRTLKVLRHLQTCHQPPSHCPAWILTTTSIPAPIQPTTAMTNCTHAQTATNTSAFHVQLKRF